ncbi:MAG: HlyD family efflux transporter periplasmic adaptor subunit [Planctomycetota bacterium]
MAVDRPTFDDNWHRVADLRPRLRSVVQVHRQPSRGVVWHVYRDPGNNRYFRAPPATHHLITLLDGDRPIAEAWRATCDRFGDEAPTQGETIQALGALYANNLLRGETPPDVQTLLERRRQRKNRETTGYLKNLMFARVPLFDPDAWLNWLMPLTAWCFGWPGLVLWTAAMVAGLWAVVGRVGELADAGGGVLAPDNLIFLYACFVGVKLIHEAGHGLACKTYARRERGGGEVRQCGVMLMAFIPLPYIDATSSWSFRSRRRRIAVASAGMYVELFVAAIAAMIWARTPEGVLIHQLAYNVMFVASVTTLLFNANPLIRFDGYYILSDLADLPNLYQRSQDYLKYLFKRYAFGVRRPVNPARSLYERVWFVVYGVASLIYKIVLFSGIILFVADRLFFIGAAFAIWGVITYFLLPIGKLAHYLASHAELARCRTRAVLATLGMTAAVLVPSGLIPWSHHGRAAGVVEARYHTTISLGEPGFIEIAAPSGPIGQTDGRPLIVAEHRELIAERDGLFASLRRLEVQRRQAMDEDIASAQAVDAEITGKRRHLARLDRRLDELSIEPPAIDGIWLVRDADRLPGAWVTRGDELGVVASIDDLIVRVVADQYLGPRLAFEVTDHADVQLRVPRRPDLTFTGTIERVLPAGHNELPSQALSQAAGGAVAIDQSAAAQQQADAATSAEPMFEVRVAIDPDQPHEQRLRPGQTIEARFTLQRRSLIAQGYLALRQLLQRRFQI